MAVLIPKSSSSTPLLFFLVQSADHITALTGASPTVKIGKNGASGAAPSGAVSEIDSTNLPGWYQVAGNATDTNTAGPIALHATAGSGDPCDMVVAQVIDPATVNMGVNLINIAGAAVSTSTAQLGVNAVNIAGQAAALDANNLLKVDAEDWKGTAVSAPATAGIPDVNAKNHGGTAQTGRDIGASVLLSAGSGAGQLDFTSGVVKANSTQWLGGTIPAVNITGVPLVDLKYTLGTISPAAAGSVSPDWANVVGKTATVDLTNTTIKNLDGNTVQTGDSYARLGAPVVSVSADIAAIKTDLDGGVNVTKWAGAATALDANNLPKVDIEAINAVTLAAQALGKSTSSICWGTCSGGTTTTAAVSALNNPSSLTDSGQLIGRTIIFLGNTTTTNVQAQASNITGSTTGATPTISFTAMTHAPANGDVFVVL